jgi:hypothetical protein
VGEILVMLKGRREQAINVLNSAFTPDTVFIMDYLKESTAGAGVLCRLAIHQRECGFEVFSYTIVTSDVNRAIREERVGRAMTFWDAKELVNQEWINKEQEGWLYLSEEAFPFEDVMEGIEDKLDVFRHIEPMSCIDAPRFLGARFTKAVPVVPGVRVFVAIDSSLRCWMLPCCAPTGSNWEEVTGNIKERLEPLAKGRGSRGLVMECFIDGSNVWISRPVCHAGVWLNQAGEEAYAKAFESLSRLCGHGINMLLPTRVSVNALSAMITGNRVGVMVSHGSINYLVGDQVKKVSFSGGYQKSYHMSCDTTGDDMGSISMKHLPDMSYLSMHCAVRNGEAAFF